MVLAGAILGLARVGSAVVAGRFVSGSSHGVADFLRAFLRRTAGILCGVRGDISCFLSALGCFLRRIFADLARRLPTSLAPVPTALPTFFPTPRQLPLRLLLFASQLPLRLPLLRPGRRRAGKAKASDKCCRHQNSPHRPSLLPPFLEPGCYQHRRSAEYLCELPRELGPRASRV